MENAEVIIKYFYTDILVMILGNTSHLFSLSLKVWTDVGAWDNQRYVGLTLLYNEIRKSLSMSILEIHAITGCDNNPTFFKKCRT